MTVHDVNISCLLYFLSDTWKNRYASGCTFIFNTQFGHSSYDAVWVAVHERTNVNETSFFSLVISGHRLHSEPRRKNSVQAASKTSVPRKFNVTASEKCLEYIR